MTDVTRWKSLVESALRKYAKHYPRSEREDVSQELYLKLIKNEPKLLRIQDKSLQRRTVCVLLRHRIFDYYRQLRPDAMEAASLDEASELAGYEGELNFEHLVEGITPTESLVLEILFKNGETQEGAAELLGRNRSWVKKVTKLALDKLRRHV